MKTILIALKENSYPARKLGMSGLIMLVGLFVAGCEDFLDINPPNSKIISEVVYKSDATAVAAVIGIYHQMMVNEGFANGNYSGITLLSGLSVDEFTIHSILPSYHEFAQNELKIDNLFNSQLWSSAYETIYLANAVLEGLMNSTGLKPENKKQLEGEARFIRAFSYFYLVNLYSDVPLIMGTDYRVNRLAARTPSSEVYSQIIADLLSARSLLSSDYVSVERVRPNQATAAALLARVYLFLNDWAKAEEQATTVIDNAAYSLVTDVNTAFSANSSEAIWQLILPSDPVFTNEGNLFILEMPPGDFNPVSLSTSTLNAFEAGDNRRSNWVGSFDSGTEIFYFPNKYKNKLSPTPPATPEYYTVLRLAEQYLIRAEARAQLSKLTGPNSAESDINIVRTRAALVNTTAVTKEDLLQAIMQERQVELFAEWGHRWLDLKRTSRANAVLSVIKPEWDPTDVIYPIPAQEMLTAPNLKPQNSGY